MSLKKLLSAKMTRKMEMVNEVDDLKTRTQSQQPGGNYVTWGKCPDISERIFCMRHFHGGMIKSRRKKKRTVVYLDVTCGKLKIKPVSQLVPLCYCNISHSYTH